ncbi:MAG: polysaccharide deacetylase family protein [Bacillota bacterium]|nr:polysaccharide deacetylase family protein [Bacillota bacterium]
MNLNMERTEAVSIIQKKRRVIMVVCLLTIIVLMALFITLKINNDKKGKVNAASVTKQHVNSSKDKKNNAAEKKHEEISTKSLMKQDGKKIVYLTFDDGPSDNVTPQILDILNKYNVKATFFVIGKNAEKYPDIIKKEFEEGNLIGNHSYSHQSMKSRPNYIYSSPENFVGEIEKCNSVLKSILGDDYNIKLVRFPGGAFPESSSPAYKGLEPVREAVKKDGYDFVDWNSETGDAEGSLVSVDKLYANYKKNSQGKSHLIILMHDAGAKKTTPEVLPLIIEDLKKQGYEFKTIE